MLRGHYKYFLELLRVARKGELTQLQWDAACTKFTWQDVFRLRHVWNDHVSWPVFTVEYFDSLAAIIPNNTRVIEVCAGPFSRQILAKQMRLRGLAWDATDLCMGQDALKLDYTAYDMIYASWIPYCSTLDMHLAAQNKPLILLGENRGCTGSEEFFEVHAGYLQRLGGEFKDVPRFPHIHDGTLLLNF